MQMSKSLLVTRPNHDFTTNYLYFWSTYVIRLAEVKSITVYDLKSKKATKKNFESYLKSKRPAAIFLNGHGNKDAIGGHENEIILHAGQHSYLSKCIVYARSCEVGATLGYELVADGAAAFIGYTRKFNIGYMQSMITKPLEDRLARLFLEPSNLVMTTIIKGHNVESAYLRSKEAMISNFRKMLSTTASYEERFAARWLWGNIKGLVYIGDGKATIT
jgi:hypothetical protein